MMRVGRRTKKRSFQPSMTTYARFPSMPCKQGGVKRPEGCMGVRGEGGGGGGGLQGPK